MYNEIVGKYTKEKIYQNELFLKDKLSTSITPTDKSKKVLDFKYNSYNIAFELFRNPNYALEPNDTIKIISVYPKIKGKETNDFDVQYVAKGIKVLGFLSDGVEIEKAIHKKRVKKLIKKQQVEELVTIKADEIILDIEEKVLLKLIDNYNKGKQMWMVKSKEIEKPEIKKVAKKDASNKKFVKRSYPIKWYKPKNRYKTQTAVISYVNSNKNKIIKKAKIDEGYDDECSKTDNLLLATANIIYLREKPSYKGKVKSTIYKNYVVPFKGLSNIKPDWYLLCDDTYLNKNDVREIDYNEYKELSK